MAPVCFGERTDLPLMILRVLTAESRSTTHQYGCLIDATIDRVIPSGASTWRLSMTSLNNTWSVDNHTYMHRHTYVHVVIYKCLMVYNQIWMMPIVTVDLSNLMGNLERLVLSLANRWQADIKCSSREWLKQHVSGVVGRLRAKNWANRSLFWQKCENWHSCTLDNVESFKAGYPPRLPW